MSKKFINQNPITRDEWLIIAEFVRHSGDESLLSLDHNLIVKILHPVLKGQLAFTRRIAAKAERSFTPKEKESSSGHLSRSAAQSARYRNKVAGQERRIAKLSKVYNSELVIKRIPVHADADILIPHLGDVSPRDLERAFANHQ